MKLVKKQVWNNIYSENYWNTPAPYLAQFKICKKIRNEIENLTIDKINHAIYIKYRSQS